MKEKVVFLMSFDKAGVLGDFCFALFAELKVLQKTQGVVFFSEKK